MRSAKLKEERLKAAIMLPPEDNPKLYENVLELAELMDALGRGEEADSYYTLGMNNKARWKQASQTTERKGSAHSSRTRQAPQETPNKVLQESGTERRQSQQRTKALPTGHAVDRQQSDAQSSSGSRLARTSPGSMSCNAQSSAKHVTEPVAPYRPKPLRTASTGLNGSSEGEVGALQKKSFQGSLPAQGGKQEGLHTKTHPPQTRADEAPAEFNQELVTRLKGLVSEQGQKVQDRSEPVAKIEPQSSQLMTESRGPAVRKRPDQRLFRPRGQIEADTKRAQLREKQQLQELEEEKLAKEKAVKEAEAAAAAQKRQEALRRSAQTQAQTPPPRLVSKTESRPWSSSRDETHSPWRSARSVTADKQTRATPNAGCIPLEGRHVLEIMGIKATDADGDIEAWLRKIHDFSITPCIRWADNTHALLVFPDLQSASLAFQKAPEEGRLWLRRYEEASSVCQEIASSELDPPMKRPQTTDIVVRRILGQALQNKGLRNKEGEQHLMEQRKAIRAQREERKQLIDSAWGGDE